MFIVRYKLIIKFNLYLNIYEKQGGKQKQKQKQKSADRAESSAEDGSENGSEDGSETEEGSFLSIGRYGCSRRSNAPRLYSKTRARLSGL